MTGVHSLKRMPEHLNRLRLWNTQALRGRLNRGHENPLRPLFDAGLPIGVWGEYIQGMRECQVKSQLVPEKFRLCWP